MRSALILLLLSLSACSDQNTDVPMAHRLGAKLRVSGDQFYNGCSGVAVEWRWAYTRFETHPFSPSIYVREPKITLVDVECPGIAKKNTPTSLVVIQSKLESVK